ncbi:MAG: hypothetical protein CVV05_01115 [Gammaproteobacteria bacterium HGW-Gammaproteobacteria-1]|jgi:hypothetical protein|nr:MAG: hypothetical protein CVV05_01115 [Gammaproteobacteria bacterium HGW-Gammaproteobacteria-1]
MATISPSTARAAIAARVRLWRLTVLRGSVEIAARECGVSAAVLEAIEGGVGGVTLDDYLKVVARIGSLEGVVQSTVPDHALLESMSAIAAG